MQVGFAIRIVTLAALVCLTGCPKSPPTESDATTAAPTPSASPSASASVHLVEIDAAVNVMEIVSAVKSRKDPAYPQLPLFEKLSVERQDRPVGTVKAEAFYDGLGEKGFTITNRHQVLAETIFAGYCLKASADPDVDLTFCEFDDAATMAKGKAATLRVKFPRRQLYSVKNSTLAISGLSDEQATKDAVPKIVAYFKSLQ